MSFFGSSGKQDEVKAAPGSKYTILGTGGQIDELCNAMVLHAHDGEESVRAGVNSSLRTIGMHQPDLVLSTIYDFLITNQKAVRDHRIQLLTVMHSVLEERRDAAEPELCIHMLHLALNEMLKSKDVVPEWQQPCSAVLVSIGMRFPSEVMQELLLQFPPGVVPPYFILKTLADFVPAHAVATVPKLKDVFSRCLPVLASVKADNMRWVFATAMGNFCEAMHHYVANIDKADDKSLSLQSFSSEVFPAYEFMFANWLAAKEKKVRLATVKAVGSMCAVIPRDQLEAQLARMIPGVLALYKKDNEPLPVTQGLCTILGVAVRDGSRVLEPQLATVLNTIHPLTCAPVDFRSNIAVRNYNELLRCFNIIGEVFTEDLLHYLLQKLDNKDVRVRMASVAILRHLVTRIDARLEDYKSTLVSGIKPLVDTEADLKVKKALVQLIIAMANHEYLSLEGGELLIEFIVLNSSLTIDEPKKDAKGVERRDSAAEKAEEKKRALTTDPEEVTREELRNMCDTTLNLVTTTIASMHVVLWPYLFELLVPPRYTGALSVVAKCIAHIAAEKRKVDADDYIIDFDRHVNLPKPQAIIARLLVTMNMSATTTPAEQRQAVNLLSCLVAIGPLLHPTICDMWDNAVPKLIKYVESSAANWAACAAQWDELILRLLSETIKIANDDEWSMALGDALANQLPSYAARPDLKKAALKHLGVVLQRLSHKEFIRNKLDVLFRMVDHDSDLERTGCAQSFGYCSASHLDIVLDFTNASLKKAGTKKAGGISSFFSSSKPKEDDSLPAASKNTLLLAFGYIAAYASPSLITSRMDMHIISNMTPQLVGLKELLLKESAIRAIDLIGKAMHPSHVKSAYVLKQRDELVRQVLLFMAAKETNDLLCPVRPLGLAACATLARLAPVVGDELEAELVQQCIVFYDMGAPAPSKTAESDKEAKDGKESPKESKKEKEKEKEKEGKDKETSAQKQELRRTHQAQLLSGFNDVLTTLLQAQGSVACLVRLLRHLEPWTRNAQLLQRQRACATVLSVLCCFADMQAKGLVKATPEESAGGMAGVGHCIAMMLPRCTDTSEAIRSAAMATVELLLGINHALCATIAAPDAEVFVSLKARVTTSELNAQFGVVHQLATLLSAPELLSEKELLNLLLGSINGLVDPLVSSTSGVCVALNGLIKQRGPELLSKVRPLVEALLGAMEKISNEKTMNGTLHAVRCIASHHLLPTLDQLLASPMPHTKHVVNALQVIGKDSTQVQGILHHLTDILNNGQPYEDVPDTRGKGTPARIPDKLAMSATAALGELMQAEELSGVVLSNYPLLLSTLLLRCGTANGLTVPNSKKGDLQPSDQVQATFRQFLTCGKETALLQAMEADDRWALLVSASYLNVVQALASAMCEAHPEHMEPVFQFLLPYMKGNFLQQRTVAAAVFAAFINHCQNNPVLLQRLINTLLAGLVDASVKLQALRGLGNIVANGEAEVNRYANSVLDALTSAIDGADEVIALEAMHGLSKVFEVIKEEAVAPIIVNICHRMQPAFSKMHDGIRAEAFRLFGTLWRFGSNQGADAFYEQLHSSLPTMILHLNDQAPQVRECCQEALRRLGALFPEDEVREFFTGRALQAGGRPLQYNEFLNDVTPLLILHYPSRISFYIMTAVDALKSQWVAIRCNAATFIGFALGNIEKEQRRSINLNAMLVSKALISALKDPSPEVRKKVAEAMSLLWSY